MENFIAVYIESKDDFRYDGLVDLLTQSDEFNVLDKIDDDRCADVILVDTYSIPRKFVMKCCRNIRSYIDFSPIVLIVDDLATTEDVKKYKPIVDEILREPFKVSELINIIRDQVNDYAWLAAEPFQIDNLKFMICERIVKINDLDVTQVGSIELTPMEAKLLYRLKCGSGEPISRNTLLKDVWKYNTNVKTATVQSHIHRVRQKLSDLNNSFEFIITEGDGYYLASYEQRERVDPHFRDKKKVWSD